MPYIPMERRSKVELDFDFQTPGELNYFITMALIDYLHNKRVSVDKKMFNNYADYNEVIGVLECVKQEFYRRVVALHEDKKREENGDVF